MFRVAGLPFQVFANRWVVFGLWSICAVFGFMVLSTLGILLPAISAELELSPSQQGVLASSAFWGNFIMAIPLSLWTSRYAPKILTTITLLIGVFLILLQGWAPIFVALLLARVAFGLTLLAREPARAILIKHWFSEGEIVLANSFSNIFFGIVVGGGLLITPFVLGGMQDSWRTTLYLYGGVFGLLTLLWVLMGREVVTAEALKSESADDKSLLRRSLMHKDLWIAGLGFVGATFAWSAFINFFPTLMLESHNVSLRWSGGILALGIFVGGVSGIVIAYLVMIRGRRNDTLKGLGVLMAGSYLGMTLTGNVSLLIGLGLLNGIAWSFWALLHTVAFDLPGIRTRETAVALGFLGVMMAAGTVLGPLAVGFLQESMGDLRLALFIVSFGPLSLSFAGAFLRSSREKAK